VGHGPRPTPVVTTRRRTTHTVVKLVEDSRKLPEKYSGRTPGLVSDQDFHVTPSPKTI
jgi:hypothetical protein